MEYNGFNIVSDGTFGHFNVKPLSRGSVPAKLKGTYTTRVFAQRDIDAYLSAKGEKNVKAKPSK